MPTVDRELEEALEHAVRTLYLKCHVRVIGPVLAKNLATTCGRIWVIGVLAPTAWQKERRMFSWVLNRWPIVLRRAT